ncbi:MAG: hypothetical protein ACR2NN_28985 [Bryobacteraceae bacterium]
MIDRPAYNRGQVDQNIIATVFTVGLPCLTVLVGILINNSRLSDLRANIDSQFAAVNRRLDGLNQRIDDSKETLRAEMRRVEEVLDARLKHLEEERS